MKLDAFKDFLRLYTEAERCRRLHMPQPWTDDTVINAYDLRYDWLVSLSRAIEALKALDAYADRHDDKGVFALTKIKEIQEECRLSSLKQTEGLLASFSVYKRLSEGRLRRWKLNQTA